MSNSLNANLNVNDSIAELLRSENFLSLDTDLQNKIIDTVHNDKEKDGGTMGKFLGTKPTNVSIHVALILCMCLLLVLLIDCIHSYYIGQGTNMDLVNVIVPVFSLSIGYIFGKGSN